MENTVNKEQVNGTGSVENQERTFTQAELDEILKSRLAKERAKYTNYEELQKKASRFDEIEEANKTELQKANEKAASLEKELEKMKRDDEIRSIREKISKDTGVPANLLIGKNEEECTEQAKAILAFKNEPTAQYPQVKDGGEANLKQKKSEEELFADWFNKSMNN